MDTAPAARVGLGHRGDGVGGRWRENRGGRKGGEERRERAGGRKRKRNQVRTGGGANRGEEGEGK